MNQKATIVSIVSEQTIPNVLFIKDYQSKAADFLFLTTEVMESRQKTQAIISASAIGNLPYTKIEAEEDEINKIIGQLIESDLHEKKDHYFLVNLTGGTKMMSLAVYDYFSRCNSLFYYLPIGKNQIIELDNKFNQKNREVKSRLNLYEYLVANGITYSQKETFSYTPQATEKIFAAYKQAGFLFDGFPIELAQELSNFDEKPENAPGTWFEEYVYHQIKSHLGLHEANIANSVMIYKDSEISYNDNEFDIMFVSDNELHVIECKVNLSSGNQKQKLDAALHKLGAISKNFGLRTNSYIFTISNLHNYYGKLNGRLLRKCEILNVKPPVDAKSFKRGINFQEIFKH
jgi:hypothetical protein